MSKKQKPFHNPFEGIKLPEKPKKAAPANVNVPSHGHSAKSSASLEEDEAALFYAHVGGVAPVKKGALNVVLGPKIGYEYTLDVGLGFGAESFLLYDFADGRVGPLGVMASVRVWF